MTHPDNRSFRGITASRFFTACSLLLFILYNFVTPPFQTPDDFNHFYRAYNVSSGNVMATKADNRVGGFIPYSVNEFFLPFRVIAYLPEKVLEADELKQQFSLGITDSTEFRDFPNTANYSPVCYLPQAVAIFILRSADCSLVTVYYGGRVAGFIFWLLLARLAIRVLPFGQWLFSLLLLMPMSIYIMNSYSADTITTLLSFLLLALTLRIAYLESSNSKRNLALILVIAVALVFTKVLYALMVLIMLVIPKHRFPKPGKVVYLSVIFILVVAAMSFWSGVIMEYYIPYDQYHPDFAFGATVHYTADYYAQKKHIIQNPEFIVNAIANTLSNSFEFTANSYVGHFGAFLGIPFPQWLVYTTLVVLFCLSTATQITGKIKVWHRFIFIAIFFMIYFAIILSQHLTWNDVGKAGIDSLQGRYIIPLMPLLLLSVSGLIKVDQLIVRVTAIVTVIMLNCYSLCLLYDRFIDDEYTRMSQYICDFEKECGFVRTDSAGTWETASSLSRSGKKSLRVDSRSYYTIDMDLKTNQGDLFRIDVWTKGGGQLVVHGVSESSGPFRYEYYNVQYVDESGWSHFNMVFPMPASGAAKTFISLRNPGDSPVYFDDLNILVKMK